MKALACVALIGLTGLAVADPEEDELTISAKDLKKAFAPYVPAVRDCYAAHAHAPRADGTLRLELVIQRDGTVYKFGFDAPGVTGPARRDLGDCLRPLSETWHFPVRRGYTTAIIPFLFARAGGGK